MEGLWIDGATDEPGGPQAPLREGRTAAGVLEVLTEITQEVRHSYATLVGNGQRGSGMGAGFMGLTTITVVFRTLSRKEIRVIKDRCSLFENIPDEEFMNLGPGECLIASVRSTDPAHSVLRVRVRPTVTRAGGETLRTTEG